MAEEAEGSTAAPAVLDTAAVGMALEDTGSAVVLVVAVAAPLAEDRRRC